MAGSVPTSTCAADTCSSTASTSSSLAARNQTPFFLFSAARDARATSPRCATAFAGRHPATEIFFASKACSNLWFLDQVRRAGINVEVNAGGELLKALRARLRRRPDRLQRRRQDRGRDRHRGAARRPRHHRRLALRARARGRRWRAASHAGGQRGAAHRRRRAHAHPPRPDDHARRQGRHRHRRRPGGASPRGRGTARCDVAGLHMHIGSQITSVEPYVRAMETALDLVERVERSAGVRLEHLNAGGGFAIPYRELPAVCEPADYFCSHAHARRLRRRRSARVIERRRPDLRLFLEPGRSVAGNDGRARHARREREDQGGARRDRQRASATNAGSPSTPASTRCSSTPTTAGTTARSWPIAPISRPTGGSGWPARSATAATCSPATTTPACAACPAATTVGDVVVFLDAGAYTLEMMSQYNARPRAAAYAVVDGEVVQIRTADTFDDMIAHDLDEGGEPLGAGAAAAEAS